MSESRRCPLPILVVFLHHLYRHYFLDKGLKETFGITRSWCCPLSPPVRKWLLALVTEQVHFLWQNLHKYVLFAVFVGWDTTQQPFSISNSPGVFVSFGCVNGFIPFHFKTGGVMTLSTSGDEVNSEGVVAPCSPAESNIRWRDILTQWHYSIDS